MVKKEMQILTILTKIIIYPTRQHATQDDTSVGMEVVGDNPLVNERVEDLPDGRLNGGCRIEMMSDRNGVQESPDVVECVRPLQPTQSVNIAILYKGKINTYKTSPGRSSTASAVRYPTSSWF